METNWNQLIERYLNNELSAEGKAAFESELTKNTELQKEFELHKLTQELIRRNSLRTLVQESGKWFHLKKVLVNSGLVLVIAGVLVAAIYLAVSWKKESVSGNEQEQIEQSMLKKWEKDLAFENIDPEYFQFTGKSDVFLSESGALLSITDESFLLEGKAYKGEAIVQWQEAQTAPDIVKAGLSTKSGDKLLETQGMFSLNAFTPEGKKLQLTDKGVYVQVPVDELKKDMKLFTGVPQKNGTIDWQAPVELERLPKPKDMSEMDLFPPRYEPKLNELKWHKEKAKRDSLYLSFEEHLPMVDSTSSEIDQIQMYTQPKMESPKRISESPNNDGAASISMMVFGKPQDIGNQTGISKIKSQKSGTENAKDKARWSFHVQYLGNNEAMVIANVTIAKNWHINALNTPKGSFGLATTFKVKETPDFTLLGLPSETKPILEHDDAADEDLAYHQGRVQFRQKIRINSNKAVTLNVSYFFTACNDEGCLPPYSDRMTIIVHPDSRKQAKSHIPPSKVLAIWNKKFNNTNLATQDFEDRMKVIHETCDEKVFDVYAKNLNIPLWELDQRVVKLGYPQFQRFADQKVGKIKVDDVHQTNLNAFYEKAIETLRETGRKDLETALKKERQWDNEIQDERSKEVLRKGIRATLNAKEEAEFNLAHIAKQLNQTVGFSITSQTIASRDKYVSGNWAGVPAKRELPVVVNIDRLTRNLLSSRKSVEVFTLDKGKKATIHYSDFIANVEGFKDFDRLYFYLFPNQVNSYERRDFVNGRLNHALNDAMDYSGLAFGLNKDGFYIFEIPIVQAKDFGSVKLEKVSEKQFDARLKQLNERRGVSASPVKDELNWLFKEKANYQVLRKRRENVEFRNTVRPTIYSCWGNDTGPADTIQIPQKASFKSFNREQDPMAISDVPANFPGGMTVLRAFINENIQIPREMIEKNITGKLVLTLIVDENGKVEQVIPKKEIPGCPECTAEGIRVAKKIPNFIPGEVNGKKVKTYFALPISFKSN